MFRDVPGDLHHTQFFHDVNRTVVGRLGDGDDPRQLQGFKAILHDRPGRFQGQALSPVIRPQPPGDFQLTA